MQRDLRRAVDAHRKDARPDPDGGVPDHLVIFPGARPHPPREDRIERDRDGAGQANLAAMSMAAQQQAEPGMRRLAVDLRRMRQQDRRLRARHRLDRFFDVVHPIVMSVVDADEVDALSAARAAPPPRSAAF